MIGIFRRLGATVATPPPAAVPPPPPYVLPDQRDAELARQAAALAAARAEIAALNQRVKLARIARDDAERRARAALTDLHQLLVAGAGDYADVVARQHKALLDYDDQLAVCRREHDNNTRSGVLPVRLEAIT